MQTHHYRLLVWSIVTALGTLAVAGVAYWAYVYFWARYQPIVLTKDSSTIQRLLDQGDWVAPGRKGPALYLLTYRACDACTVYQRQEFPKLAAVGVDTRVLVFVRPDLSGQSLSSPQERATVAELWINRDWSLYDRWMQSSEEAWAPAGLRQADGDWARSAVVGATHVYVDKLTALLKENGVTSDDPIVIWRDKKGRLKACACSEHWSYHFVRSDFGAPDTAPPAPKPAPPAVLTPAAPVSSAPAAQPAPAAAAAPPPAAPATQTPPATGVAAPTPAPAAPLAASGGGSTSGHASATKMPPARSNTQSRNVFY